MQRFPTRLFSNFVAKNFRAPVPSSSSSLRGSFYGTMRAARYYGKEDIRVEQVPEPSVCAGQIKVRDIDL